VGGLLEDDVGKLKFDFVGTAEGIAPGCNGKLGEHVGKAVGPALGSDDDIFVGIFVFDSEGGADGMYVGGEVLEGEYEGPALGPTAGVPVGARDTILGKTVGQLKSGLKKLILRIFRESTNLIHFGLMASRSIMRRRISSSNRFRFMSNILIYVIRFKLIFQIILSLFFLHTVLVYNYLCLTIC